MYCITCIFSLKDCIYPLIIEKDFFKLGTKHPPVQSKDGRRWKVFLITQNDDQISPFQEAMLEKKNLSSARMSRVARHLRIKRQFFHPHADPREIT